MQLWQILEDSQTIGALKVSLEGYILACNYHAAGLFGLDTTAMVGRSIIDLTSPEDQLVSLNRMRAIQNGEVRHAATTKTYVHSNHSRFVCSLELWVIHNEEDVPLHIESVLYHLPQGESDAKIAKLRMDLDEIQRAMSRLGQSSSTHINLSQGGPGIEISELDNDGTLNLGQNHIRRETRGDQ